MIPWDVLVEILNKLQASNPGVTMERINKYINDEIYEWFYEQGSYTKNSVWVLTTEHEQYDTNYECFVSVFESCPTHEQLILYGVTTHEHYRHIWNGNSPRYPDEQWFNLKEVELK